MFLELTYRVSGKRFLINTSVIAGVEMNGTEEKGSVLTLTTMQWDGERGFEVQSYESVKETISEIFRRLHNAGMVAG